MADTRPLIPVAEPDLGPLEERYVLEAVRSGWVSSIGAFIDRFEKNFAEVCGVKHCVALANGTVALHLALISLEIGAGDEVIVPDLTFVATAASVVHAGATPVLVDVDPVTGCIDPELVEGAISPRTRAIIAVHLFGHPADMTALRAIAARHGIVVLEDAAEAHGARLGGVTVGGLGQAACFSFYGNKLITTGEGGCITTDDDAFAERARFLKDHAMSRERRYWHPAVGFNYRMTNLQAALGCAQIERFPEMLRRKSQVLAWYREAFEGTGISLNPVGRDAEPVCWLVVAQLPNELSAEQHADLHTRMRVRHQVDLRPLFVPVHELPPYSRARFEHRAGPVSSHLAARGACLPSSNHLERADVQRVARSLLTELHDMAR